MILKGTLREEFIMKLIYMIKWVSLPCVDWPF